MIPCKEQCIRLIPSGSVFIVICQYSSDSSLPLDSSYLAQDLSALPPGSFEPAIDINQQTDSNHDTALTLAAAGMCVLIGSQFTDGNIRFICSPNARFRCVVCNTH